MINTSFSVFRWTKLLRGAITDGLKSFLGSLDSLTPTLGVHHQSPVGATLVVARLAYPDVGGKSARHPQPGSLTPTSVVNRKGDHKGRPYRSFF